MKSGFTKRIFKFVFLLALLSGSDLYSRINIVKGLKVGDEIFIVRPCTEKWIKELKMDSFIGLFAYKRLNWAVGSREVKWDRKITRIEGNTIFFDGPITTELDANLGQSYMVGYQWPEGDILVKYENIDTAGNISLTSPEKNTGLLLIKQLAE